MWSVRIAITLLCLSAGGTGATSPAELATLRFATSCAQCHEGECSGRLSFARNPGIAFDHIRQYAGPTDDELARQLYAALERMKSHCSYPPLTAPDLARPLGADELAPYRDAWSGAYFLPLAALVPGEYRLAIELSGSGRLRIELIDGAFDPIVDRCLDVGQRRLALALDLGDHPPHYLRLRPRGPLQLHSLRLVPAE